MEEKKFSLWDWNFEVANKGDPAAWCHYHSTSSRAVPMSALSAPASCGWWIPDMTYICIYVGPSYPPYQDRVAEPTDQQLASRIKSAWGGPLTASRTRHETSRLRVLGDKSALNCYHMHLTNFCQCLHYFYQIYGE